MANDPRVERTIDRISTPDWTNQMRSGSLAAFCRISCDDKRFTVFDADNRLRTAEDAPAKYGTALNNVSISSTGPDSRSLVGARLLGLRSVSMLNRVLDATGREVRYSTEGEQSC
jgi:hypothetical protein